METFWNTKTGLILRWVGYFPVGLMLLLLVQASSLVFLSWLFQDTKGFFIIGLLLGGVAVIPAAGTLYYLVFRITADMCPSPKIGMVVFGISYYLFATASISGSIFLSNDSFFEKIRVGAIWLVCGAIAAKALKDIWKDNRQR